MPPKKEVPKKVDKTMDKVKTVDMKSRRRPSRQERNRESAIRNLMGHIDPNLRTRGAKKVAASFELSDEELVAAAEEERRKTTPPQKVNGKNVYSGKSRTFTEEFIKKYWKAETNNGKKSVCCAHPKCGKEIDMAATDDWARSIDHITPWATVKLGIETKDVCYGGVHWRVVMSEDMREAFQDEDNLQPMHVKCNSSKNGPKDTDSISPQRVGMCLKGADCDLPKGS